MEEREIIVLGFGNYSTLVAAQWANSTSRYDAHHKTLYRERDGDHVLGGDSRRSVHVPRLLLLDAPHASDFKDLAEVAGEMKKWEEKHPREQEVEDAGQPANVFADPASSLLWQKPSLSGQMPRPITTEEKHVQKMAQFARRRWGQHQNYQRTYSSDDDCANEESDAEEESEEDYYFQLQRHQQGIEVDPSYHTTASGEASEDEKREEEGDDEVRPSEAASSKEFYKKKLFRRKDGTIPWWRYITTGLDVDSITTMRPPHHVDAGGEFPTLHNVGYGLSTFKSGNSAGGSAAEAEALENALRRQIEDADGLQGLQCFIDGDSMFAGAAHNTLTDFWEDVGPKMPVTAFTVFSPLPAALTDVETSKSVPFAERRRDEVALNRLLCTSMLSQPSAAVYIPIEVAQWGEFFAGSSNRSNGNDEGVWGPSTSCWWLDDDTATAQYIAAVADSAILGTRDGGGVQGGPRFYMSEWARTLRPMPSMRVSALLGSLPLPIPSVAGGGGGKRDRGSDLWNFLEGTPLLPGAVHSETNEPARSHRRGFTPLTHAFSRSPLSEAGRVVGHAVTLRGAGVLPSAVYPTSEAMLRYAAPLRTATYLSVVTQSNLPLSSTFPLSLLFDTPEAMQALESQCAAAAVSARDAFADRGVDVGAHAITSYQSAAMLGDVVSKAKAALRYKERLFSTSYSLEKDDWAERLEDVAEMFDDYHHQGHGGSSSDSDDDPNDW